MKIRNDLFGVKLLACLALLMAGSGLSYAQTEAGALSEPWVRIESPGKDFSFSVPASGYLVDNEDGAFRIYFSKEDFSLVITIKRSKTARADFKRSLQYRDKDRDKDLTEKEQFFEQDDFLGRQRQSKDEETGHEFMWISLASPSGSHSLSVNSKSQTSVQRRRFLQSVRLNEKLLFDASETFPEDRQTLSIASLKTDERVLNALRMPDATQADLDRKTTVDEPAKVVRTFSKSMVVLRRPRAVYTDGARLANAQGTVRLLVKFLADGTIGPIKLISSLHRDLDNQAFKAVRKMKFLPAEINGKPVDLERVVEYSFSIY